MNILITGSEGQLGRSLRELLKESSHQVLATTHMDLDITNLAQVREALQESRPQFVINAAAYNLVDKAEDEPELAMAVNKTGPENLAIATAELKIPLVHVSSDYVFDGKKRTPYFESDKTHPLSVYAMSKLGGEEAVLKRNPASYAVRTAWVYHPVGRNFLNTMLSLKDKPELKIVNDQFGSPTYAPHLAQGIMSLVERQLPYGIYHLAGRGQTNWFEFASRLFQLLKIATPLKPIPAAQYSYKAVRPAYTVLSTERDPSVVLPPWEQGLEDFVRVVTAHGM